MQSEDIILEASSLSKRYCKDLHRSLHYAMVDMWANFRPLSGPADPALRRSEFWALRNVNFKLKRGESLGILGRNGSGKSTLLKILNGTIKPTTGNAIIRGNMRLLALGAGFNPILSGRENIHIACSLFGFDRRETKEKYEQIVEFSEIKDFIDAPVKTYSSGMYARLGFSVAIHSNPEILLVDEALAAGDLPFVTKCLRRINDFRADGGTLVLVNHSGYAIRQNCNRAMWLSSGEVKMYGEAQEVATEYEMFLAQESGSQGATATTHLTPPIESLEIECPESVENGDSMDILVKVEASGEVANGCVSLTFFDASNTLLFFTTPKDDPAAVGIHQGSNVWKFHYPSIPLMRGAYKLSVVVFAERFENQYASQLLAKEFKVNLAAHESTSGIFTVPSVTTKIA